MRGQRLYLQIAPLPASDPSICNLPPVCHGLIVHVASSACMDAHSGRGLSCVFLLIGLISSLISALLKLGSRFLELSPSIRSTVTLLLTQHDTAYRLAYPDQDTDSDSHFGPWAPATLSSTTAASAAQLNHILDPWLLNRLRECLALLRQSSIAYSLLKTPMLYPESSSSAATDQLTAAGASSAQWPSGHYHHHAYHRDSSAAIDEHTPLSALTTAFATLDGYEP